ncbi:hypothetical protein EVAR_10573_1 [Eumeta japonica]|uniref:Uncharacterized protein n=1 Tax=Eumeta variegata TaxID=151549 RepID=A0A4C1U1X2_EUMVA|nr:hypothetical protein EVAR_10573_1 [Eumeta japonica]
MLGLYLRDKLGVAVERPHRSKMKGFRVATTYRNVGWFFARLDSRLRNRVCTGNRSRRRERKRQMLHLNEDTTRLVMYRGVPTLACTA